MRNVRQAYQGMSTSSGGRWKEIGRSMGAWGMNTFTILVLLLRGLDRTITRTIGDFLKVVNRPLAIAVGFGVGYVYGPKVAIYVDQWTATLLLEGVPLHWWEIGMRWLSALLGAISGWEGAEQYERLSVLRRKHSGLFEKYREVARPQGGWLSDLVWSYLAGVVIIVGSFTAGCLFWPILPFLISDQWWIVILLLLLLASGWQLVALAIKAVFTDVFKPRRLEYEVQNSPAIIQALDRALAERRSQQAKANSTKDDEVTNNDW